MERMLNHVQSFPKSHIRNIAQEPTIIQQMKNLKDDDDENSMFALDNWDKLFGKN